MPNPNQPPKYTDLKSALKYTDVMKPQDINIAHCWLMYAAHVLPAGAPAIQRDETRKSFYAGFVECFKIMSDLTDTLPEDEVCKVLDRLDGEARDFYKKLVAEHPVR